MRHTQRFRLPLCLALTIVFPAGAVAEGQAEVSAKAAQAGARSQPANPATGSFRSERAAGSDAPPSPRVQAPAVDEPSQDGGATVDSPLRLRLEAIAALRRPSLAPRLPQVAVAAVPVLEALYCQHQFRRVWHRQGQARDLIEAIARSTDDGLHPADFHAEAIANLLGAKGLAGLDGDARDDADLLLSDSLLRYLHHRLYGKVDPAVLDRKLHVAEAPTAEELAAQIGAALDAPDLGAFLTQVVQEPPFYTRLKEGLARYRAMVAAGGWDLVGPGGKLSPGIRSARVGALRERLRVSGEYQGADPADPRLYDEGLAEAVRTFQRTHGLVPDGVVGARTLTEIDVPAEQRLEQIRVNLERMRWVYRDLPPDYLLVDVVGARVYLMRGGDSQWSTKAQVGRADRQTPAFRDQVEYLEINPTWTVPPTILKNDILPKARVNPGYVAKKGLKAIDRSGRTVPLSAVNWNLPASNFPYLLRQDGGTDKAALGRIKFMFPNRFSVYLHDTPQRSLFDRPVRMTSSGCVRVDQPFELAERVLGEPERWTVERLKELVASGKRRTVRLKQPLAIVLAYWTADGLGDGRVRFRPDVYGRDAAVAAALAAEAQVRIKLPPEPVPVPPPPAPVEATAPKEAQAQGPSRRAPVAAGSQTRAAG